MLGKFVLLSEVGFKPVSKMSTQGVYEFTGLHIIAFYNEEFNSLYCNHY